MTASDKIVKIATAENEIVAELWRDVLFDEGVIAVIKPGGPGHAFGTNALNVQHLLVREDQADEARAILAQLELEESEPEAGADDEYDGS
jgi:hypothetical protein